MVELSLTKWNQVKAELVLMEGHRDGYTYPTKLDISGVL